MTVTIDPSDMRPLTPSTRGKVSLDGRKILLAGIGGIALITFTVGAFSFFNGLADPRAKSARPSPVAAAWPELKDGVPALTRRSVEDAYEPALATVVNLPRPDEAGPQRSTTADPDFRLLSEPPVQADSAPPASAQAKPDDAAPERSTIATAAPANPALDNALPFHLKTQASKPNPAAAVEAPRPVEPPETPDPALSVRKPPPIENAEIITGAVKTAFVIAPARTVSVIAPSRSESVRARAADLTAFVSLPAGSSSLGAAQAEAAPMRIELSKPVAAKVAAPKPVAAKAKPVQPVPAKTPVMQVSAAPAAIRAAPIAAAQDTDDPEVMGVKIPGGRHVRDSWKAVFGVSGQN